MKVRWSEIAVSELEAIFIYILEHSRSSAETVARLIIDRAESLGEFPLAGEHVKHAGTRKLAVVNYPYVIFYRIDAASNEVQILNIRHTARKSPATD